ncbi:hypothetical protein HJC23_002041 [Cyclotella cryptica]|uniref:Cyclin-like domain-containing protein n=1 Tax=Cyclotella cryptica TaxID=29204 RepID=A0ABD3Q6K9_9STRA|eukprot:CCRYP_008268-RA/>CCRYP_008268-RA protein AED:0.27 eAED:0.27 QI:0/-1/0/1/-1/1/1/0/350
MSSLTMQMSPEQCSSLLESKLLPLDVADRVAAMQRQESTHYRCRDYIRKAIRHSAYPHQRKDVVDAECRAKMCDWCYQVTDFCKFSRQTVATSMSYLDRFMSTNHLTAAQALYSKKKYQLAAMTCLYMAIKLFEPMAMDTALLSEISHGCYDEEDIERMEQDILQALGWRMNGPTTHDMLSHLIMLLPKATYRDDDSVASALLDFSRFQVEIAISDYGLALEKPSVVALAAILNSAEGISEMLFSAQDRYQYLQSIMNLTGMNSFTTKVNAVRIRLLTLFEMNSGYHLPQIANLTPVVYMEHSIFQSNFSIDDAGSKSPVSVTREALSEKCQVSVAKFMIDEVTTDNVLL